MRAANLVLRFLLELAALTGLGVWGFQIGDGLAMRLLLGLGAPLLMALVWGFWISPKAPRRLPDPLRLGVEVVIFAAAGSALIAAGYPAQGWTLMAAAAVSEALMVAWGQRGA
jgi:hypothetical protein